MISEDDHALLNCHSFHASLIICIYIWTSFIVMHYTAPLLWDNIKELVHASRAYIGIIIIIIIIVIIIIVIIVIIIIMIIIIIVIITIHLYSPFSTRFKGAVYKN